MKPAVVAVALFLIPAFAGPVFTTAALAAENPGRPISSAPTARQVPKQAPRTARLKTRPHPRALRAPPSTFGWRPADPSFDPQGRPYQPPPGLSCPIDLGYGRWASCNDEF